MLVSFDSVSLYSNIETELGLEAIRYWLKEYRHEIPDRFSDEFIIDALKLVITNNMFYFDISYYSQKKGVAPTYATLVLGFSERMFYDKVRDTRGESMKEQIEYLWKKVFGRLFYHIKNQ